MINEGGVIEPQTAQGGFEFFVVAGFEWIQTTKHHGAHFLVAWKRLRCRDLGERQRIPGVDVRGVLDGGNHVTDVARRQGRLLQHLWRKYSDLFDFGFYSSSHEQHVVARFELPGKHPSVGNHSAIRIVNGVEHQCTRPRVVGPPRRRDICDHRFQNVFDADS